MNQKWKRPAAAKNWTEQMQQTPVPREIGRANKHDVKITWQDGLERVYVARELRLACPCAGCIDEFTGQLRLIATSVPQDVHPMKIERVGNYAVTIHWSDGHHTGIYSFEMLYAMREGPGRAPTAPGIPRPS